MLLVGRLLAARGRAPAMVARRGGSALMGRDPRQLRLGAAPMASPSSSSPLATKAAAGTTAEAMPASASAPSSPPPHPATFKAHLDFKYIKDNLEAVVDNCRARNSAADPRRVAELYDQVVARRKSADALRAQRNDNAAAMKQKDLTPDDRQKLVERGQQLKRELEQLEADLTLQEAELQAEGQRVPNDTHPDVPRSSDEADAGVVRLVGARRDFAAEGFEPRDHVSLAEALDLVDFEAAATVSGSKFYYLRNAAAMLELALVSLAMQRAQAAGFSPMMTPDLVRESVLEKCGFQPRADNTQVYSVSGGAPGLCLTGTAEVPLGGFYMDRILSEAQLPVKMAAFGHCFRTEAGAAGSAGKGLYRVHQFSKVELFVISAPEQSDQLHKELLEFELKLYEDLGLHFRVLDMPTGDLGAPAYRKFDVEAWMPGLGRYGEISSASNCTDYQARRLNLRYRPSAAGAGGEEAAAGGKKAAAGGRGGGGKKKGGGGGGDKGGGATAFVHTLNATAVAVPRMIVAILESNQQKDGSVVVPEVLRPYLGGLEVIRAPAAA
jgi:seryl-tRNA synthetase